MNTNQVVSHGKLFLCLFGLYINPLQAEQADVTHIDLVGTTLYKCAEQDNTYRGWVWISEPVAGGCNYFTFNAGNMAGQNALSIGLKSKTGRFPVRITYTTDHDSCVGTTTVCTLRAIEIGQY